MLALDPDSGKMKTYFQYHQNNSWDWDEVDAPMLIDLERDGRTIKSLIHPGRNAIFWVLERKPDSIKYVAGWPFVHTDVWKGIEPESGRPMVDPAHKPVIGKRVEFCPSCGAARIGRRQRIVREPSWSMCRPMRISAAASPVRRCRWLPASFGSGRSPRISA